ncbi:MAG: hypothetical protein K0S76_443 [Herbinix sp.]|jgi:hypothetical protein|nr:hypothetical protein [Herbinix sp.]
MNLLSNVDVGIFYLRMPKVGVEVFRNITIDPSGGMFMRSVLY